MPWAGQSAAAIWPVGLPPAFGWHLLAHILLLQGVLPQGLLPYAYVTLLGPAWSLSTEWQFYLLIGLIAPRTAGGIRARFAGSRRSLSGALFAALVAI